MQTSFEMVELHRAHREHNDWPIILFYAVISIDTREIEHNYICRQNNSHFNAWINSIIWELSMTLLNSNNPMNSSGFVF